MPQNSASATRRAKRLEIVGSRTDGFNLMARVHDRPHRANHAEENRMGSPRHDSWEARAYGSRWVPLGDFEYSRRLTLPPMGLCEDDSENSVEQRKRTISQQTAGLK